MTTDYGAHWTPMTNGLPADQYVFVVRQDPREPRLLFAGTRSTAYVSLDGGAQWQPFTLNLPGVQVRDLAIDVREGELVAATHGRAFWILDNLALLEQLARQTSLLRRERAALRARDRVAHQAYGGRNFRSRTSARIRGMVRAVFFNLPPPTTARRRRRSRSSIRTARRFAASRCIRRKERKKLTPNRKRISMPSQRARDMEDLTAVKPGDNLFQWDLHYAPAFDSRASAFSTDDFPDSADGPTIVPGAYTVVLQYGSQRLQAPFNVALDPRMHPSRPISRRGSPSRCRSAAPSTFRSGDRRRDGRPQENVAAQVAASIARSPISCCSTFIRAKPTCCTNQSSRAARFLAQLARRRYQRPTPPSTRRIRILGAGRSRRSATEGPRAVKVSYVGFALATVFALAGCGQFAAPRRRRHRRSAPRPHRRNAKINVRSRNTRKSG